MSFCFPKSDFIKIIDIQNKENSDDNPLTPNPLIQNKIFQENSGFGVAPTINARKPAKNVRDAVTRILTTSMRSADEFDT
jgi:hypothetical protein